MDKETKFINMYNTMASFIDYGKYVEDVFSKNIINYDVDYESIDFNVVQMVFINLFFTIVVDEYIEKTNENGKKINNLLLNQNFVDELALIISTKSNNRYEFPGGLSYDTSSHLISTVRNKLAHGDYIIKNNCLCFTEKGIEASINIDNLINFVYKFINNYKKNKLYGQNNHSIAITYDTFPLRKMPITEKTVDKYLEKITVCSIKDEPINMRTQEYIDLYEKIDKFVLKTINNYPKITQEELEKKIKDKYDLSSVGMNLEIEIKKLKDQEYYTDVLNYYYSNKELLEHGETIYIYNTLSEMIKNFENKNIRKSNCLEGILLNLYIIDLKNNFKDLTIEDICKKIFRTEETNKYLDSMASLILSNLEDGLVTTYLAGFNVLYQYGLEKGYTELGDYDITKLASGEYLDYSKINVDVLYSEDAKIEYKYEPYEESYKRLVSDQTKEKYDSKYEKALLVKQTYLENSKEIKEEKIKQFNKAIDLAILEKNNYIETIENVDQFLSTFDKDQFIKNIDTISHVRNAISHGFVYIDAFDGKIIADKNITFKDLDNEGNIVYEKTVAVREFVNIFLERNMLNLLLQILKNIKKIEKINPKYMSKLLNIQTKNKAL